MKRFIFLCALLHSTLLAAAAIRLTEVGTADMGVASAGSAAVARDAGTAYFNPAGMTRFERDQLVIGTQLMAIDVRFRGSSQSLFRGGDGGQAGAILPGLGLYYIHNVSKQLKLGLSVNSPYGGMYNYGKNWKGRYFVQREFLPTLAINPSLAVQLTPRSSIGIGGVVEYGYLTEAIALNPILFGGNPIMDPDGRLELNMDSFAYGYNIGYLYEFNPCARFGLTYRSRLKHRFKGTSTIQGPVLISLGVDTEFVFADFINASLYTKISSRLALLGSLGWEHWSLLKRTVLSSDNGGSFTIPRGWKDTWHAAVGVEYQFSDPLLLQTGFSYDSSPTSASRRTPDLPMDQQLRFATGLIYECNCYEKVSFAAEYVDGGLGRTHIRRNGLTLLKGHYANNNLYVLNATYIRKF